VWQGQCHTVSVQVQPEVVAKGARALDGAADARAAAGCSLAAEVVSSFGGVCLRVTGTSMLPSVWPGDILTICRADMAAVRPGQIVLFTCKGWLLAHRVVAKVGCPGEQFLITRGDSLPRVDPPVSREELLGTVTSIVRRGRRITPRLHLTFYECALSFILRHSERATNLLLRLHAFRQSFHHGDTEGTEVHGHTEEGALCIR